MTWFKIDDAWYGHPKVLRLSDAAVALFVMAGTWSSHYLTDGAVPVSAGPYIRLKESAAQELIDVGLWHATLDGYQFSSWEEYQPTRAKVELARERWRSNVAEQRHSKTADKNYSEEFRDFWNLYPRKVGKPNAAAAFARALRRVDSPAQIMAGLDVWVKQWDDPQFIPHPTTWLNRNGWEDVPTTPAPQQSRFDQNAAKIAELQRRQSNANDPDGRREITDNRG